MSVDLGLEGKIAVVTGGGGAICGAIAVGLARQGAVVSIWDLSRENGSRAAERISGAAGTGEFVQCDVTEPASVRAATEQTLERFKTVDILVNGAGGSVKEATTSETLEFFDLDPEAMRRAVTLNYFSALLPCQTVGKEFARRKAGVILNISSIAGITPLSRAVSYSDAKAAVNSFTRWLAVHMAVNYAPTIRVNALAPGFILTDQNRFLLRDENRGCLTPRGEQILRAVPMARLGRAEEIVGAALWVVSDQASFVTGAVIPIDGGFTAYCAV